jgi:GDPmannose 4,6-dehydratase
METVIITGANGQLGQHMIRHLLTRMEPMRIIGTTRRRSHDSQPFIFDRSRIQWATMELTDPPSVEKLIIDSKPDYFINTAADTFVGLSWQQPVTHLEQNTLGVLHQLEAIKKHSPGTRYFNSGSSEEFGDGHGVIQDENTPLAPRSPYGASKCAARHLLNVYRASYGLWACSNWSFNFESVLRSEIFLTRKITMGAARIRQAIDLGQPFEPIEVGNLNTARSWAHASDVADAIWRTLNADTPKDYVVSSPEVHSLHDLVDTAFEVAGVTGKWYGGAFLTAYGPTVQYAEKFKRPNDVHWLGGNSARIQQDLGWRCTISFRQLIEEMVNHDLAHLKL